MAKGSSEWQAGSHANAITTLEKLVELWPNHLDGNFLLGSLYAQTGRLEEALLRLRKARELAPRSPQVANNLGNVFRMLGQNEDALDCYASAVKFDPRFSVGWMNLGLACTKLERWKDALESFARLGNPLSEDPDVLCAMGSAQAATGNTLAAINCYERALPSDADGRRNVKIILARLRGANSEDIPERHSDASVIAIYRNKAASWDADVAREQDSYFGPRLVAEVLGPRLSTMTTGSQTVLDLGCGTGACGDYLRPIASELVGVDLSPDMLTACGRKGLYDRLVEADIGRYLAEETNSFDIVVAAGVFILFSRLEGLLAAIRGRMKTEGVLAFTLYASANAAVEVRHNDHFGHSADYVRDGLTGTGWRLIELREIVHETEGGQPQRGFVVLAGT